MIVEFYRTANCWWAKLSNGKSYVVHNVFQLKAGYVAELVRHVEGNFCEYVNKDVKIPEELM